MHTHILGMGYAGWCVMRGAEAERSDCSECCVAGLLVWGIRKLNCSGSNMLGEGRRKNKGLVRWGRSGLIESLGPRLNWSETCYRNPVSWFPNKEGICSPLGLHSNLSVICVVFSWLSAPVLVCYKSDFSNNMETLRLSSASGIHI